MFGGSFPGESFSLVDNGDSALAADGVRINGDSALAEGDVGPIGASLAGPVFLL